MNIKEQLEDIPNGRKITVVRPMFGMQSDSFFGELWQVLNKQNEPRFNLSCEGIAIMFSTDDVASLDFIPCSGGVDVSVIRLKSPSDYEKK